MPATDKLGSADRVGAVFDTLDSDMSDASMTPDAFIEEMRNTLESAG